MYDQQRQASEAARRSAEQNRRGMEQWDRERRNRRSLEDARRFQDEARRAYERQAHEPLGPAGPYYEPREQTWWPGVPAWKRLLRTVVCVALIVLMKNIGDSAMIAAFQGQADPQSATAIAQATALASLGLAAVGFYNFVRMVFRILANLFR